MSGKTLVPLPVVLEGPDAPIVGVLALVAIFIGWSDDEGFCIAPVEPLIQTPSCLLTMV